MKESGVGLSISLLLVDLGHEEPVVSVYMNASAGNGVTRRTGLGKIRHLQIRFLCLQDKVSKVYVKIFKILGTTPEPCGCSAHFGEARVISA